MNKMLETWTNALSILNKDRCPFPQWYLQQLKEQGFNGWMSFIKKKMQKDGSELVEIEYVYLKKDYLLNEIWTIEKEEKENEDEQ